MGGNRFMSGAGKGNARVFNANGKLMGIQEGNPGGETTPAHLPPFVTSLAAASTINTSRRLSVWVGRPD